MRAIFGLAVFAAGLALQSAFADQIEPPIQPATYPFLPTLTVNNEPAVCGSFESVVIEAFKGPGFQISIEGLEWPEAKVEWPTFSDLGVKIAITSDPYPAQEFSGLRIDRDGDGGEEILAHAAWEHSWRGNMNFLALYPDLASFKQAKLLAEPEKLPLRGERATIPDILAGSQDMTPGASSGALSAAAGQIDANNPFWRWSWARREVLKINGQIYFLDRGEVYDDEVAMALWRLPSQGGPRVACEVALFTDHDGFSVGRLGTAEITKLEKSLRAMAGIEGGGGGTLHAHTSMLMDAGRIASRLALRPWVLQGRTPYNSRSAIDNNLWIWSHLSLWNFRQYRQFTQTLPAAYSSLSTYYRDEFGYDEAIAGKLAANAIDVLVGNFFVFRSDWDEAINANPAIASDLRREVLGKAQSMLLEGNMPIVLKWESYVAASENWWPKWPFYPSADSEPILFYALEHPDIVEKLLQQGVNVAESNAFGKTALMYAAQFNLTDTAAVLLRAGADIEARTANRGVDWRYAINRGQRTALMYALENAGPEMVSLLLTAGATSTAKDSSGGDALDYLEKNTTISPSERKEVEILLRKSGYRKIQDSQ
jgi:hypothetical protein